MSTEYGIEEYLTALKSSRKYGPQVVFHQKLPAADIIPRVFPFFLDDDITQELTGRNIEKLYSHQQEALNALHNKKDVLVATPTASGKSLIYNIPVIESFLKDPCSHSLYLFPLKSLAQDQLRIVNNFSAGVLDRKGQGTKAFAEIYDGDTSPYLRSKIRKHTPPVLITNPDMLHLSILPFHDVWSNFIKNLKFIVIDEVHTYRGVFGAHMAWVIRRLQRIALYYGAHPQFILLSATIGNPESFGSSLIGKSLEIIKRSGAPSAKKHMVMINPWDSAAHTASKLLEAAMHRGLRTIVYTKSRKMTELITMWTKPRLGDKKDKLSSYRAGFLPEERREIEKKLSSGTLLAVISTSALELGIDIGDLDLCILVGYPGSIMATWQRGGRVGRGLQESAIVFIAGEDALDQHFMRNPADFFIRKPENAAINPDNSKISRQHLHCAAAEIPLEKSEPLIAKSDKIVKEIEAMTRIGVLFLEKNGLFWFASRKRPQRLINLRGGGGDQLSIIDTQSGEIIGEIDAARALKETHNGAIYLHHSQVLQVTSLDTVGREVLVEKAKSAFYTKPMIDKNTHILSCLYVKSVFGSRVSYGSLRVTEKVTGYQKINSHSGKIISTVPLDLPEIIIETEGIWIDIPEQNRKDLENDQMHFMGAIHAIEHAMIAMFPLLVLCDRNDIGGISCPYHEQTEGSSIFIYDGYSGGAGLTLEAYTVIEDLLRQTCKTMQLCPCETGCPSCVHSPKCGSGNRPIDKAAAIMLLEKIINNKSDTNNHIMNEQINLQIQVHCSEIPDQKTKTIKSKTGLDILPESYGVFDLETKKSAAEVGGWKRADKMGVSVGVVYDSILDGYVSYMENEMPAMVEHLKKFDLVVGFNNKRFDNQVLSPYTQYDLYSLPAIDLLEEIYAQLNYRLSLDRLAEHTLGTKKSADGLKALEWYKKKQISKIVEYCKKDVELTKKLFLHALENNFLLFKNKAGSIVRLPIDLSRKIEQIIP